MQRSIDRRPSCTTACELVDFTYLTCGSSSYDQNGALVLGISLSQSFCAFAILQGLGRRAHDHFAIANIHSLKASMG